MAKFLRMPGVSADADAAILSQWSIEAGATVAAGDVVAEVETEKAVVDIEADDAAVVHTLLVDGGATVGVSDPIAVLLDVGEDASAAEDLLAQLGGAPAGGAAQGDDASPGAANEAAPSGSAPTDVEVPAEAIAPETDADGAEPAALPAAADAQAASGQPAPAEAAPTAPATGRGTGGNEHGRIFSSPIARKIARENDLDIRALTGTGPGGRIVRKDVEAALSQARQQAEAPAAAAPSAAAAPAGPAAAGAQGYTDVPHSRLRRFVAARLQESKQVAPHFYLRGDVRVDRLLALRAEINEGAPVRVSVNDFFVKAVARALQDVPDVNVTWADDYVRSYERSDVGVAIASDKGLVTPVIRGADQLPLTTVSARVKDFAQRANEGRLKQDELEGGSFTVTNLGMFGVDEFSAIINPPQAGILAVGAARKIAAVTDEGGLEPATVVGLTLSVDHRPVDGALAATWFARLRELLENPLTMLV
ncbi:2-oxo acid dehydrogenase subunit E2 [Georgenia sp. Z1491]|uniref:2-oxo acid dehydrogenase subunit E2 n=1 Tax=Georgenia sp. Z1491 TaxID=3416707 RepID=UPI003CF87D05